MDALPGLDVIIASIRSARQKAGISSQKLAKESGISPSTMSKLEKGRMKPSYALVYKVTRALEELASAHGASEAVKDRMIRGVTVLSPVAQISEARRIMKEKGFSQIPIVDRHERIVGLVTERSILEHPEAVACVDAMEANYAIVGMEMSFERARELARNTQAVLVVKDGRLAGILTKADFI
ncbi:MAG: CBS domain-containing protein [Candidatus Marsarchaeota archaeon]|jgi:predicted transcriptional regulator|nr:CBS domain-containing protein [Candidatus Marsarchaeota archaeon]